MNDAPTLIIFAEDNSSLSETGVRRAGMGRETSAARLNVAALDTLRQAMSSGLPIRFVAPSPLALTAAALLPGSDIVEMGGAAHQNGLAIKRGPISAGVLASAQSPGWLIVPANMPNVRAETLRALCLAMRAHPLVHPVHQGQPGPLLGCSSEFFSELIRVDEPSDLGRLLARYPSVGIDMDDPGLLPDVPLMGWNGPATDQPLRRPEPHQLRH